MSEEDMMNPQRAYISGPSFSEVPALMISEPHVGDPMQLFLDDGKVMRTSAVRRVSRNGSEVIVDTQNSRYRVTLKPAA
jgi:hypothetical protein